jgi:hypothetical protein
MLKKSASFVLASFRPSTYRSEPLGYRNHWRGFSVRQDPLQGRTAHTKCGLYLLGPSLAAALLGARRVAARKGWVGEKSGLLSILAEYSASDGVEWCGNSLFYERGSSLGEEAVLADSGWAGEVAAGTGLV